MVLVSEVIAAPFTTFEFGSVNPVPSNRAMFTPAGLVASSAMLGKVPTLVVSRVGAVCTRKVAVSVARLKAEVPPPAPALAVWPAVPALPSQAL